MKVLAVDDEKGALRVLERAIELAEPNAEVVSFQVASECLSYCQREGCPDIAFLDIRIASTSGLELAKNLRQLNPNLNVVFTTGYSEYASKAFETRASGYLLKPVTPSMVSEELDNLRYPVDREHRGLYAQTFGTFELFNNGRPVHFKYAKTKELFAYLFDRHGALCSNESVLAALWETDGHESYYRQLRKDLADVLFEEGCGTVVLRRRGSIGLDMNKVSSDYQDWQQGIPSALNAYRGEYMSQYSWAEVTNATLW